MHLVEITPAPCNVCGRGNTPDSSGERIRFVDFERDINWNDPLIMCEDCIANAGGMVGMASKDMLAEKQREVRKLEKDLHEAKAENDNLVRRGRRLGIEFVEEVA